MLFAGYKTPHPLHPYFLLKIQTDGSLPPAAALEAAASRLIATLSSLEGKFRREFSFKDGESGGAATAGVTGMESDPYGGGGVAWGAGRDYLDF